MAQLVRLTDAATARPHTRALGAGRSSKVRMDDLQISELGRDLVEVCAVRSHDWDLIRERARRDPHVVHAATFERS